MLIRTWHARVSKPPKDRCLGCMYFQPDAGQVTVRRPSPPTGTVPKCSEPVKIVGGRYGVPRISLDSGNFKRAGPICLMCQQATLMNCGRFQMIEKATVN